MIEYIHLGPSRALPEISKSLPFRAVLIVEGGVTPEHRAAVSRWLVEAGSLYVMTWGAECESWADSVHRANLDAFDSDEIPDHAVVMTTAHEHEPLGDVFWFSKHTAMHPCFPLDDILLLHLSPTARERDIIDQYLAA